jgi:hypothetical protein
VLAPTSYVSPMGDYGLPLIASMRPNPVAYWNAQ